MSAPDCRAIAQDYLLWGEYVDPGATMSESEFDALTIGERLGLMLECDPGCECECQEYKSDDEAAWAADDYERAS